MSDDRPLTLFDDPEHIPAPIAERTCPCCHGRGLIKVEQPVPSAPARPNDPETSHDASKNEPDLRRFRDGSRASMLLRLFHVEPSTAVEATLRLFGQMPAVSIFEGTRRRVSDLVAAGYIEDSGERRSNPGSAELSIVWQVTSAGKFALYLLDSTGWSR